MSLSTPYAQSSTVYAKGEVGRLQEPEVVDDLNEVESPDTVELIHILRIETVTAPVRPARVEIRQNCSRDKGK